MCIRDSYSGELHSVTYTPGETAAFAGSNWLDMLREAGVQYE